MEQQKPEKKYKLLNFKLSDKTKSLWDWVNAYAKSHHTTRAAVVVQALIEFKEYVERKETK